MFGLSENYWTEAERTAREELCSRIKTLDTHAHSRLLQFLLGYCAPDKIVWEGLTLGMRMFKED